MPTLTAVRLVLHDKFAGSSHAPDILGELLADYLVQDLPLYEACGSGSLDLLELLWSKGLRELQCGRWSVAQLVHSDRHYKRYTFSHSMRHAIHRGDIATVQWLVEHFSDCQIGVGILATAANRGQLEILRLLETQQRHEMMRWGQLREMPVSDEGVGWGNILLTFTGTEGHWQTVRWLDERVSTPETRTRNIPLVMAAFQQHKREEVEWLVESGFGGTVAYCPDCSSDEWQARAGIVRYLLEKGTATSATIAECALEQAASFGDLSFVTWVMSYVDEGRERPYLGALKAASKRGHLSVVQVLLDRISDIGMLHGPRSFPSWALLSSAEGGQLAVVKWLCEHYRNIPGSDLFRARDDIVSDLQAEMPSTAMEFAAAEGHLDVLQFLHRVVPSPQNKRKKGDTEGSSRSTCTTVAMDEAAAAGHLDVVKWLHENRPEGCTARAMDGAACNGHFDVVKWLHANRSEGCQSSTIATIIYLIHDISKSMRIHGRSLRAHGLRCDHEAFIPESFHELFEIIQWLFANRSEELTYHDVDAGADGSAYNEMDAAAADGNLELLKWLHENTTVGCTASAVDAAAKHGWLPVVKWLQENRTEGCTTKAMGRATKRGHLEVVQWLHLSHIECSQTALQRAAASGHVQVVKWLLTHCVKGEENRVFLAAARGGNLELVRWLLSRLTDASVVLQGLENALLSEHFEAALFLRSQCTVPGRISLNGRGLRLAKLDENLSAWIDQNVQQE